MDKFGADALRFFLMNSAVTRGEDLSLFRRGREGSPQRA